MADAHFRLSKVMEREGDCDAAIRAYRKTLNLDPERDEAHFAIGRILRHVGRTAEAQEEFQFALKMRPCDVEYLAAAATSGESGAN